MNFKNHKKYFTRKSYWNSFIKYSYWIWCRPHRYRFDQPDPDAGGQGHRNSGHLCLVIIRPERQTTDGFFRKSGQNPESEFWKAEKTWQIKFGLTDTSQDFPENPDKNETRIGHRQCCPSTSAPTSIKRTRDPRTCPDLTGDGAFIIFL